MLLNRRGDLCRSGRRLYRIIVFGIFLLCVCVPSGRSQKPIDASKPPQQTPIQLDTAQETNDRIAQLAIAANAKQGDYVIGNGDLLNIEVFEVPELSREVRVNDSGYISIPLLPDKVKAAGLTPFQLQDALSDLLKANGLVSNPQITISLKELHSQPITVIGAVAKPSVIQATHQMSLVEVLSQVGGIASDAGSEILVSRTPTPDDPAAPAGNVAGQPYTLTIDLDSLLNSGDSQYNIPILGGDVIRVPRSGVIYVVGAVMHAGGFVMQSDRSQLTVIKAVSLAGGLQPSAKSQEAVILRRDRSGVQQHVPVNVHKILTLKSQDVTLQQSDILYVPDSVGKRALRRTGDVAVSLATGVALFRATAAP